MSEKTRTLAPKLRFSQFQDAEAWEEVKLGQLGELVSGLTYSPDDIRDSGLLVLRSSNVQNGKITLDDNVYVTPDVRGANLSKPNDILICVRNGSKSLIGKNALIPEGMPVCTHGAFMTIFRSPTAKFVFQLFQTSAYQKHVDGDLGATINSINGSQFIKYKFYVPKPLEQQQIANCLSSIDELISAQTQKIAALKDHKKGLMQQLFPDVGETIPKLRFPEFRSAGMWSVEKLTHYIEEFRERSTKQDEYEVLTSSRSGLVRQKDYYDNSRLSDRDNDGFNIIPPGYITYRSRSDDGLFFFNLNDLGITGIVSVYYPVFGITSGYNTFFVYLFANYAEYIGRSSVGNAQKVLSLNEVRQVTLPIPPVKDEQKKIADCLSSIDNLITSQIQKLEALKTHKNGLMQQLFPSVDEVSE